MRVFVFLIPVVLMAQSTAPKAPAPSSASAPKTAAAALGTDEEKTIYALGLQVYRSLAQFDLSPAELELVQRALADAVAGKPAVNVNEWAPKLQPFGQARSARVAEREKAASKTYLAKAAAEPGAIKTESGLIYMDLQPGTGASPKASDSVKVNYRGTLIDGTEFDSSYKRNQPAQFPLSGVIRIPAALAATAKTPLRAITMMKSATAASGTKNFSPVSFPSAAAI